VDPQTNANSLLKSSGEFLAQLSDSVMSLTTESNILEKVPFASFIVKAFSLKEGFHLWRLERNCRAFMAALREGDTSNLSDALRKITDDPKLRWEIEDTTLQILIESEKPIKAEILGRLLLAVKDNKLSAPQFDTLSLMLINASVPALYALPRFYEASQGRDAIQGQNLGSFEPLLLSMGVAFRNGTKFQMDECGRDLFHLGLLKRGTE
jgi:hypothetical protein